MDADKCLQYKAVQMTPCFTTIGRFQPCNSWEKCIAEKAANQRFKNILTEQSDLGVKYPIF